MTATVISAQTTTTYEIEIEPRLLRERTEQDNGRSIAVTVRVDLVGIRVVIDRPEEPWTIRPVVVREDWLTPGLSLPPAATTLDEFNPAWQAEIRALVRKAFETDTRTIRHRVRQTPETSDTRSR